MNVFFGSDLSQLVGWSLLHFVWQGVLIAVAIWTVLAIVPARRSNLRYAFGCLGLLAMAVCPAATLLLMSNSPAETTHDNTLLSQRSATIQSPVSLMPLVDSKIATELGSVGQSSKRSVRQREGSDSLSAGAADPTGVPTESGISAAASFIATGLESLIRLVTPLISGMTVVWALGVCLLSLKLVISWLSVRRIQQSGRLIQDPQLQALFERLKMRLRLQVSIPLRESIAVHSPTVIGWLRPVVLLPASAVSGLSQQQLSAIFVHELAHIRRADYLVNLLQSMIETLLFYHPAVWWLSNQIRHERESCCDDLAVSICGDRQTYVSALLKLEQLRAPRNSLAMASHGGDLVNRVARLIGKDRRPTCRSSWIVALAAFLIAGTLIVGSAWNPAVVANSIQQDPVPDQPEQVEESVQKLRVLVTTPDGKPLAGAALTLGVWYQETANTLKFTTGQDGTAELPVPDGLEIYRLWASAVGYTPLFANWENDEIESGNPPPSEFEFQMIPAVEIGGVIVDENGQAIKNAAVEVRGGAAGANPAGRVRFSSSYALNDDVKTNAEGRWSLANLPPGDDLVISLRVTHSDYISDDNWGGIQSTHSFGLKELRDQSAKLVLRKGNQVRGKITDEEGEPIQDALVIWGDRPYWQEGSQEILVNPDGTYETPTQKDGELRITVVAPGYAPETAKTILGPDQPETDFVLSPGNRLEIRFVNENGDAVPGAYAQIEQWRKVESLYNNRHPNVRDTRIPIQSDEEGVYLWEWAPDDAVEFNFSSKGYILQRKIPVVAGEDPITVVLKRPQVLTGTVTDAAGKSIPSFSVIPRLHLNDRITSERRRDLVPGENGQFSIKIESQNGNYSLLVEADGYESTTTDLFPRDQPPGPFEIQMNPSTALSYTVMNDSGEPVSDATIIVAPADQTLSLSSYFNKREIGRYQNTTTDSKGTFRLPVSKVPRTLLAVSPEYYGQISDDSSKPASTVRVQPWSRLKYYITKDGQPWQTGNFLRPNRFSNGRFFHIQRYRMGSSGGDGIFKTKQVAPLANVIDVFSKGDSRSLRYQIAFMAEPGKEFNLDFTDCPRFKAKINFVGQNTDKVDLANSKFSLRSLEPTVEIPTELVAEMKRNDLEKLDSAAVIEWFTDQENWDAMKCFQNCFDIYAGPLTEDGNLTVDVLRPGKYELSISAHASSKGAPLAQPLSEFKQVVEIGAAPADLGTLNVSVFDDPKPGAVIEDFQFTVRADQSESSLTQHQGKYVLLDFWTPWCDACEQDTPKVQRLASMLASPKKTTMISLMTNGSGHVVRVPSEVPAGNDWIDGQVSVAQERHIRKRLGVWTSQHFVLLDPNGKYVVGGSFVSVVNKMEELGLK